MYEKDQMKTTTTKTKRSTAITVFIIVTSGKLALALNLAENSFLVVKFQQSKKHH